MIKQGQPNSIPAEVCPLISHEQYGRFFDNAPVYCFIISPQGVILNVNSTALRALGYAIEELKGRQFETVFAQDSEASAAAAIERWRETSEVYNIELIAREKTGKRLAVLLSMSASRAPDGSIESGCSIIRDITDVIALKAELRSKEHLLSDYLEIAGVMIVALDTGGRVTLANRKACEVLGCAAADIIGHDWFEIFLPEGNRANVRGVFNKLIAGDVAPVEHYDNPVLAGDNTERMVSWHNSVLFDDAGNITGILSSGEDITDRLRMERELRASEEKYRTLNDSLSEIIYRVDPLTKATTYVNSAVTKIFGYTVEEWSSEKGLWQRSIHPDDRDRVHALLKRAQDEGRDISIEYRIVRKDGQVRWVEERVSFDIDVNGAVTGVNGIIYDISDRKNNEDALKESRDLMASVAGTALDAIVMIDDTATVLFWNKAAQRIFGYTSAEAVGASLPALIVPERYHEQLMAGFGRFVDTGDGPLVGMTVEMTAKKKDGAEFPIEHAISAVKRMGKWCAVGIIRDITARRAYEGKLTERLDELERFHKATVGRELKLHDLKLEIKRLKERIKVLEG